MSTDSNNEGSSFDKNYAQQLFPDFTPDRQEKACNFYITTKTYYERKNLTPSAAWLVEAITTMHKIDVLYEKLIMSDSKLCEVLDKLRADLNLIKKFFTQIFDIRAMTPLYLQEGALILREIADLNNVVLNSYTD